MEFTADGVMRQFLDRNVYESTTLVMTGASAGVPKEQRLTTILQQLSTQAALEIVMRVLNLWRTSIIVYEASTRPATTYEALGT